MLAFDTFRVRVQPFQVIFIVIMASVQVEQLARWTGGGAEGSERAAEKYDYVLHDAFSGDDMQSILDSQMPDEYAFITTMSLCLPFLAQPLLCV